ncbi:dipeptide epimerase [Alteromonas oceanisediminis]|uniref:dipeptide epimerase n=1 Tax=Alteromonas oceanisediminis TaxID=2836180 RepID=UPI001BDA21C4|nr:dipeptide epimerase [Alteromonas oceanisediminis]MBT0585938.1 dipeptide epimerase [Alteromonas oceanisediminis]
MNITHYRLAHIDTPLHTPFKTAVRTVDSLNDLVVMLETDTGHVGFGSAPSTPLITGDTHATITSVIQSHLFPAVNGAAIADIQNNCARLQKAIMGHPSAKAAVEIALYDLWAQQQKLPLYKALGGTQRRLKTDYTISVNPLDEMMNDCRSALDKGYDCLKIKIGNDFSQDIDRIISIYNAFHQHATLRLDVNQGWTIEQSLQAVQILEKQAARFELIEQPVRYDQIEDLAVVTARSSIPVMADESASSVRDVRLILTTGAADIINIKLMKCGGLSQAIDIARMSAEKQKTCMMGCMLEGSISVAAAAHFAAAFSDQVPLIDLDGPTLGQFDPLRVGRLKDVNASTLFDKSLIELNDAPGLGILAIK